MFEDNKISIVTKNCPGIKTQLAHSRDYLHTTTCAVCCVQETWLDHTENDAEIIHDFNFSIIRQGRSQTSNHRARDISCHPIIQPKTMLVELTEERIINDPMRWTIINVYVSCGRHALLQYFYSTSRRSTAGIQTKLLCNIGRNVTRCALRTPLRICCHLKSALKSRLPCSRSKCLEQLRLHVLESSYICARSLRADSTFIRRNIYSTIIPIEPRINSSGTLTSRIPYLPSNEVSNKLFLPQLRRTTIQEAS